MSDTDRKILETVARLRPYGKLEIAMNQNGKDLTLTLTNPERTIISLQKD